MLVFVIFCNFLLIILNFYVAFHLWKIRRLLIKVTKISTSIERHINYLFEQVPVVIIGKQLQIYQVRQLYQQLTWKLQKLQQSLQLINLGLHFWKSYY